MKSPRVSGKGINLALQQAENILSIAKGYGSLAIVRGPVSHQLSEFSRDLWHGISQDPPRWLNLSIRLESKLIFDEALIHCAGGFPNYKWPTSLTELLPVARSVVTKKAARLSFLRSKTDIQLCTHVTIPEDESEEEIYGLLETKMLIYFYHEWLAAEIRRLERSVKYQHNDLYRIILKGGDAYLHPKDMEERMDAIASEWNDVLAEQLKALKNHAFEIVLPITKNNLFIEADNLPYLTCTEVVDADHPWLR